MSHPLTKATAAGDSIAVSFEDLGARADGYGAYVGDIGDWYGDASVACGLSPPPAAGLRQAVLAMPAPARYVLVTAANPCAESPSGGDCLGRLRPMGLLDCPP